MCSWWLLEKCVKNFPVPTAERNLCSVFWSFCFLYLLVVSSVSSSSTPHAFCSLSGWPKIFCFSSLNLVAFRFLSKLRIPRLTCTEESPATSDPIRPFFWNREWKWQDVTDRGITPDGSKLGKWVGEYLQLCALWQGWYKCTYRGMQLNVCARVCAWGIFGGKKKLAWPEVSRLVLLISIKTLLDE